MQSLNFTLTNKNTDQLAMFLANRSAVRVSVTAIGTGGLNLVCAVSQDNVNWQFVPVTDLATGLQVQWFGMQAGATYAVDCAGYLYFRIVNYEGTLVPAYIPANGNLISAASGGATANVQISAAIPTASLPTGPAMGVKSGQTAGVPVKVAGDQSLSVALTDGQASPQAPLGGAATAPADAEAATTKMGWLRALLMAFNGATLDRLRSGIIAATATVVGWLNVLVGVQYATSAPTLANGQFNPLQGDVSGNLKATLATQIAGEDLTNNRLRVYGPCTYYHQAATAAPVSATIKSGAGTLRGIIIGQKGTSGDALTIYDNTTASGTVIAVIDATAGVQQFNFQDVAFATGLSFACASGNCPDVTFLYW